MLTAFQSSPTRPRTASRSNGAGFGLDELHCGAIMPAMRMTVKPVVVLAAVLWLPAGWRRAPSARTATASSGPSRRAISAPGRARTSRHCSRAIRSPTPGSGRTLSAKTRPGSTRRPGITSTSAIASRWNAPWAAGTDNVLTAIALVGARARRHEAAAGETRRGAAFPRAFRRRHAPAAARRPCRGSRRQSDLEVRWGSETNLHEVWDGRALLASEHLGASDLAAAIGALAWARRRLAGDRARWTGPRSPGAPAAGLRPRGRVPAVPGPVARATSPRPAMSSACASPRPGSGWPAA